MRSKKTVVQMLMICYYYTKSMPYVNSKGAEYEVGYDKN